MRKSTNHRKAVAIEDIANTYKDEGYRIKLSPASVDLPPFLKRYRPVLIVTNDREKVVVEVKTRSEIIGSRKLVNLAKAIESQPGWRLDLALVKPEKVSNSELLRASIGFDTVMERLATAQDLAAQGNVEASLLTAWSAGEVVLRRVAQVQDIRIKPFQSASAIQGLYSFGVIGWRDYEFLRKNYETRNQIAHGLRSRRLSKQTADRLIKLIEKLLKEALVSDVSRKD